VTRERCSWLFLRSLFLPEFHEPRFGSGRSVLLEHFFANSLINDLHGLTQERLSLSTLHFGHASRFLERRPEIFLYRTVHERVLLCLAEGLHGCSFVGHRVILGNSTAIIVGN